MGLCRWCDEKPALHTASDERKCCKSNLAVEKQIFLWQPQKTFHHIKRENNKTAELRLGLG
jgi:hypothetical protein